MFNQNQQSFHTASYRGNMPGHDQALRSDSSQPSSFGAQGSGMSSFSSNTPVASQYRGFQRTFQPTGYVQSVYGQNSQQSYSQQAPSPSAYHGANYRGNEPGHDQYLRADSTSPSSFSNSSQSSSFTNQLQPFQSSSVASSLQSSQSSSFQNQFSQQAPVSGQQYHLANYKGNEPGHDQYLRADSQQPSQFGRSF